MWEVILLAKLRVYISGPYSKGDTVANIREACLAAARVINAGHLAYVPHTSMLLHLLEPRPYADWLAHDLGWLAACDVVLRLPGESPGADVECRMAERMGIPVVRSAEELGKLGQGVVA